MASKRKRTSGTNKSSVGLRQPAHKKRKPEIKRFKRSVPLSLEENPDKKRRSPNRNRIAPREGCRHSPRRINKLKREPEGRKRRMDRFKVRSS
ncbi:hypothetical protein TNIN_424671 [Trichonephila inaurata madagascariensis]|uniref:Uncharacterized protein n=1 Tax=Trichonephila inaurata madagascariensis TaxID=2747483 RepID=A0A8X7BTY5_9ARAC|nr:hypothetical protein TNIN_424671 [Trichonephila inaurata madagascariensis]